ncbi:MAG: class I SAM-dependent methyltransferase [Marmoricola sp.]
MNGNHAAVCSSEEWAEHMRDTVMPRALGDAGLGDRILEIGPGYGPVTALLSALDGRVTSVELDAGLAARLAPMYPQVRVLRADASRLPLPASSFSAAVCCTMLHHVPTAETQDAILAEAYRVLRPGGVLVGSDSMDTGPRREFHEGDVFNPVDPDGLPRRLATAGFADPVVAVYDDRDWFTFRARRA